MNQSRWCLTAALALGALACSDPVPPPAQGSFIVRVQSQSPTQPGTACPTGAALTFEAPNTSSAANDDEGPTPVREGKKIIDGESNSGVSCTVKGKDSFTFSGTIDYGNTSLSLSLGTIGSDRKGTARVALADLAHMSGSMASEGATCAIDASTVASIQNYVVQPGSMWAHFACDSVFGENAAEVCRAQGDFVLENCIQE